MQPKICVTTSHNILYLMETIIQSVNNLVSVRFKLSQRNYFIKRIAKNYNSFFKIPNTKKKLSENHLLGR